MKNLLKMEKYHLFRNRIYWFGNLGVFLIALFMCCCLKSMAKAVAATSLITFVLSLYLGYGTMLNFPVSFLPVFQIRQAVSSSSFVVFPALLISGIWVMALLILSWKCFCKCDLK